MLHKLFNLPCVPVPDLSMNIVVTIITISEIMYAYANKNKKYGYYITYRLISTNKQKIYIVLDEKPLHFDQQIHYRSFNIS